MNRPQKIARTLLGIVASVGLWSLTAARPQATLSNGCCRNIDKPITASPTPAPKKPKAIPLTFKCGPDPSPIKLKEPYAHGRKTPLSFREAVDNYYWTGGIASLRRCTPGPDSEEVNTYIKKEHRGFYEAVLTEVEGIKTE